MHGWDAVVQFEKNMAIRYYSGTLIYAKLYFAEDENKRYGDEMMSVSVKEFQMYAVPIINEVKGNAGGTCHASVVPLHFNPLRFINHSQYLKENLTPQLVQHPHRIKCTVGAVANFFTDSALDL